jgi:16S rRNA (guanine966-N2)-methyltransferase
MRVVAGTAKGMRLKVPRGHAMRPTSDMVREAVFDILSEKVAGARVLDLFAGTGALGIEALSRGAAHAVLVERSARCVPVIKENLAYTRLADRARLVRGDVYPEVRKLDAAGEQFDLVFADPPYEARGRERRAEGDPPYIAPAGKALQLLAETGILSKNAVVVIEHASRLALPAEAGVLKLATTRRYGSTSISIYRLAGHREPDRA